MIDSKKYTMPADLRALRGLLGLSQMQYARACADYRGAPVTQAQISAWERGEKGVHPTTRIMLEQVAVVLCARHE